MKWKVEVKNKPDLTDPVALGIKGDAQDLGIYKVESVKTSQIYQVEGDLPESQIEVVGSKLLTDSITQLFSYQEVSSEPEAKSQNREVQLEGTFTVEVSYKPGVADAVGDSVKKGIRDLGFEGVRSVKTAQRYYFYGELNLDEIDLICKRLLANEVIQVATILSASSPQS